MGSPGMVLGLLLQLWDDPTQNRNPIASFPGFLFVLLGAGSVGVAVIVLGAWFWGRRRCQQRDSGNSPGNAFYSNVLYRPRGAPKKSEDCSGEGKDQRGQSIYSTSFPQPATRQLHLAPRPCPSPRPGHAASTVRVSPRPSPTLQPRPKGFPKVGEE
nr:transmembrane and immunoglobulin domain-containing protein 2 isoform X3 [Symphalangus syndactylus]